MHGDWRTPTINILLQIADFGRLCGYMNMHTVAGDQVGTVFVSTQQTGHNPQCFCRNVERRQVQYACH